LVFFIFNEIGFVKSNPDPGRIAEINELSKNSLSNSIDLNPQTARSVENPNTMPLLPPPEYVQTRFINQPVKEKRGTPNGPFSAAYFTQNIDNKLMSYLKDPNNNM
jgi:hypothetical protein